jgi:hypothetical protein
MVSCDKFCVSQEREGSQCSEIQLSLQDQLQQECQNSMLRQCSFLDVKRIVMPEYITPGETWIITFCRNCTKRGGGENGWIPHQRKCPSTQCVIGWHLLAKKQIPVLSHVPYSPDLDPWELFLFPKLKYSQKWTCLQSVENIKKKGRAAERDFAKRFSEMLPGIAETHAVFCRSPRGIRWNR